MYEHIEFRCSYALTNMSLEEFTKKMKVEHVKKPGEDIDYKVYRTSTTPLTDKAMQYCQNDVLGLYEALTVQLNNDGDNLYTVPMTSTGYVRRETKQALRMVNHNYIKNQIVPFSCQVPFLLQLQHLFGLRYCSYQFPSEIKLIYLMMKNFTL